MSDEREHDLVRITLGGRAVHALWFADDQDAASIQEAEFRALDGSMRVLDEEVVSRSHAGHAIVERPRLAFSAAEVEAREGMRLAFRRLVARACFAETLALRS
jgi:hypothetical protein